MKDCTYTYQGETYTYQDLANLLLQSSTQFGILYSKEQEQSNYKKQKETVDKLYELKDKSYKELTQPKNGDDGFNLVEGSGDIEVNATDYTIQTFIDSTMYVDKNGEPLMPVLNNEEWIARERELLKSRKLPDDEIEREINILRTKGDKIAQHSYDLHKILLKEKGNDVSETEENVKGTAFENLADTINGNKVYGKIMSEVRKKNGRKSREYNDDSSPQIIKNVNLSANITGTDKKIHAHIDFVSVKPDGSLEIFLIKGSHEPESEWDPMKKKKYRNEMGLIMQILEANGIDTFNVTFNILPVYLTYDEQFNEVLDVEAGDSVCYSHNHGGFILTEALQNARRFIETPEKEVELNDEIFTEANKTLKSIFPDSEIMASGVEQTAEEYVDSHWYYLMSGVQPESGYQVNIDGELYTIKDTRKGRENRELVELVKSKMGDLVNSEAGEYSARSMVSKIKDGRRYGFANIQDSFASEFLGKYYRKDIISMGNEADKFDYDWKIIQNDDLTRANVILFKNRKTKQINIVIISAQDLKQKRKFGRNTNILGYHLTDMQASDNQGHELLSATNGNIEIMRGLVLLNELIPSLKKELGEDIKLGEIEVIGGLGTSTHGLSYPISQVLPNFIKARQVLNQKDSSLDIKNNFQDIKHISPEEIVMAEYSDILTQHPNISKDFKVLKDLIYGSGYKENGDISDDYDGMIHVLGQMPQDSLSTAKNIDVKIQRLEELIEKLSNILRQNKVSLNQDALVKEAEKYREDGSGNNLTAACARVLISASIALDRLSGIIRISQEDLSSIDSTFQRPQNMANSQVRICSKLLQDAVNNTSYRLDPVISEFNNACIEFYEKKGYSKAQNMVIGNQASLFSNLYQDCDTDLIFKNPYDPSSVLDIDERRFLKKALFLINKIRYKDDEHFIFTDENDQRYINYINSKGIEALLVPLEKASPSTKWSNPSSYFRDFKRRLDQYAHNPTAFFKEMYDGIMTDEEREMVTRDMENMQTRSSFSASESKHSRQRVLAQANKDLSFFETNVQNLVIDYAFKAIQAEEMNKVLVRARGILLYLKLTGIREEGNEKKFDETIKHIDKYLTTTVWNKSIMTEDSQKIIAKIQPLRKMVTTAYIMASPVAAMRDTVGGFISNVMRSAFKFRTDIDVSDVMWGYKYVIGEGVHSAMDVDLLDKMNAKYLISNVNREQQQEGYKSNREGITNPSNLAYATLKKPDFLNRMVLFMAKLKHDGSKDAYSVKNGQLVYNWRMDKRFDLLASNNKNDMEAYNKQLALKLSLIHALNQENPGLNIPRTADADIPDGYTRQEIESIKALGDTIYGSYDKSTKAMYENMAIGSQFGVFSTWMNGIVDVYFGKRRESSYQFEKRQAEDENGNLLWLNEEGEITTEDTGVPYLKNVPLMVQGVFNTVLKDFGGDLIFNGGRNWKQLYNDPMQQMNLRRAFSDLLVALILGLLFKFVITPAYKEHKKNDDGKNIAANAILEVMYKGTSTCFDEFKGPWPIIDYVSNNTSPAAYKWLSRTTNDAWKLASGQRSLGETIVNIQALPRAFQDSYKMYVRDTQNGIEA